MPPGRQKKPPRKRNPVARVLRRLRPKVVPKATNYSRKRLRRPTQGEE